MEKDNRYAEDFYHVIAPDTKEKGSNYNVVLKSIVEATFKGMREASQQVP